jgi:hypothetical protein
MPKLNRGDKMMKGGKMKRIGNSKLNKARGKIMVKGEDHKVIKVTRAKTRRIGKDDLKEIRAKTRRNREDIIKVSRGKIRRMIGEEDLHVTGSQTRRI